MKEIMSVMPWLLVTLMAFTIQSSAPGHGLKVWRSKPRFNVGSASLSMGSHSWMHRGSHIWRPLSWKLYLFYLPSVVAISFPGPASLHWPQELLSFFPLFFVMSAACGHCLSMVCFFFLPREHDSAVSYSNSELNYLLASRDRWLGKGLSVWAGFIAVLISFVSPAWETSNQHRATTQKGDKSHIRCALPVLTHGNTKPSTQTNPRVIQIGIQKPASLLIT